MSAETTIAVAIDAGDLPMGGGLMALGFVWAPHKAAWEVQLARLAAYKAAHGDCSVPHCCVPRTSGSVTGLGTSG